MMKMLLLVLLSLVLSINHGEVYGKSSLYTSSATAANLIAHFPLLSSECNKPTAGSSSSVLSTFSNVAEALSSEPNRAVFGNLAVNSGNYSCPIQASFTKARNGIDIPATSSAVTNMLLSQNDITAFKTAIIVPTTNRGTFSVEMWVRPTFSTSGGTRDFVLLDIGGSGGRAAGDCGSDVASTFGFQLRMSRSAGGAVSLNMLIAHSISNVPCGTHSRSVPGYSPGKMVHIVFTVKDNSATLDDVVLYVNNAPSPFSISGGTERLENGPLISNWTNSWKLSVGAAPSYAATASAAFEGEIAHVSFYNGAINATQVSNLYAAGPKNMIPANLATYSISPVNVNEDIEASISVNQGTDLYDADNDASLWPVGMLDRTDTLLLQVKSIPLNTVGVLKDGTTNITSTPFNLASTIFDYTPALNFITNGTQIQLSALDDVGAVSSVNGVVIINIVEQNDLPVADPLTFTVTNEKIEELVLQGRDIDVNSTLHAKGIKIRSVTGLSGQASIFKDGSETPLTVNEQFNFTSPSGSNLLATKSIFFKANVPKTTQSGSIIVASLSFTYCLFDEFGNGVDATVTLSVRNAIIAGCNAEGTLACEGSTKEETDGTITLKGFVGDPSINKTSYSYILKSLPDPVTQGSLFLSDGTTPVTLDSAIPSSNSTDGSLTLTFVPVTNYYNQYCRFSDPVNNTGGCSDGNGNRYELQRGTNFALGTVVPGCQDSISGCPVTFDYQLQVTVSNQNFAGPVFQNGGKIWVTNVNDNATMISPASYDELGTGVPQNLSQISPIRFVDVDRDTQFYIFSLKTTGIAGFSLTIDGLPQEILNSKRIVIEFGGACLENSCEGQPVVLRGTLTDLNLVLSLIEVTSIKKAKGLSIEITLYEQVDATSNDVQVLSGNNGPFDNVRVAAYDISNITSSTVKLIIPVSFGEQDDTDESNQQDVILIYAGIAAAGLFVLVSCAGIITGICRRARRGEKAAVWIVRNILCSHVSPAELKSERFSIQRRKSLEMAVSGTEALFEASIHAEHKRLREVVICANLFACLCPCCCGKYKANTADLPSEEELTKVAIAHQREKMAEKHKPKDPPPKGLETAFNASLAIDALQDAAEIRKDAKKRGGDDDAEDIDASQLADDSIFDWEKHIDAKSGRPYYYNSRTNQSSWEPPKLKVHRKESMEDFFKKGPQPSSNNGSAKRFEPRPPQKAKE